MATPTEIASLKSLRDTLATDIERTSRTDFPSDKGRVAGCRLALTSLDAMAQLYGWWETAPDAGLAADIAPGSEGPVVS